MRSIIIILFLLTSLSLEAQLGYLGRRTSLSLGLGSNYVFGTPFTIYEEEIDNKLVLPRFNFGLNRENRKGRIVRLEGSYQELPDIQLSYFWNFTGHAPNIYEEKIETALIRATNYRILYGLRFFQDLAPLGMYYELRFAIDYIKCQSYQTATWTTFYPTISLSEGFTSSAIYSANYYIPEIGFQVGHIFPLNRRLALDIGSAFNINFGGVLKKNRPYDLRSPSIHQKIAGSKLLTRSNILELHLNLIIFP